MLVLVTAAGDGVDLTGFDMIVCVSQAPGTGSPVMVAWPYGGYGVNVDSSHGRVTGRGISMPNEWGDGSKAVAGPFMRHSHMKWDIPLIYLTNTNRLWLVATWLEIPYPTAVGILWIWKRSCRILRSPIV